MDVSGEARVRMGGERRGCHPSAVHALVGASILLSSTITATIDTSASDISDGTTA
jgi:hypothetical protein